jgi:hypothetical protein
MTLRDKYSNELCKMRTGNGDPCRSRALIGEDFCHYHKLMGPSPVDPDAPFSHIYLPRLESAASIQAAISEVCELMLHRRIEPKEASALFYAMQVAPQNLVPLNADSAPTTDPLLPGTIQACADQPRRRHRGRPRKAVPRLVRQTTGSSN